MLTKSDVAAFVKGSADGIARFVTKLLAPLDRRVADIEAKHAAIEARVADLEAKDIE